MTAATLSAVQAGGKRKGKGRGGMGGKEREEEGRGEVGRGGEGTEWKRRGEEGRAGMYTLITDIRS